jgi:hypothetical protein
VRVKFSFTSSGCPKDIFVLQNKDVPGVVGAVGTILGQSRFEHRGAWSSAAVKRAGMLIFVHPQSMKL